VAGSREILEWFAARSTPTFALFGRHTQVSLASAAPKKTAALHELVDRLVACGHHRIVMLVREERRKPEAGFLERIFLEKLETCGIRTSAYNLPDWGDRPEELKRILDSLFKHTPPTALIVGDVMLFPAVQQHLGRLGILVPDHVSLACIDFAPPFDWCRPTIAHIAWDFRPLIKRVVSWANQVSHGKNDRRKSTTQARFVDGGTIGPVAGK
jgi:DNA-binding LacI/PurR family transcriptional regulator